MPLASLCAQQLGMPHNCCKLFLQTLANMQYHIKTSNGISQDFYGTTTNKTMHGPGQGGRGSSAIWVIISSLIMTCINKTSLGSNFKNPYNSNDVFRQLITGFVDDITHWCSCASKNDDELLKEMTATAQKWEQLLYSTGGQLELTKCFFYLIRWITDKEGVSTMDLNCTPTITITDSSNKQNMVIQYKKCNESHKSLGVLEAPYHDTKHEYERLLTKIKNICSTNE